MLTKKTLIANEMNNLPIPAESDYPVYFDIETTGLSWRNSHTYLLGFLYPTSDTEWTLEQWFLDHPFQEKEMLGDLGDFLNQLYLRALSTSKKPTLIHYNGNTFDLPYLTNKYRFYQIPNPLTKWISFDLYRELRPYKDLYAFASLKLQAVEEALGFSRTDHSSGKDLIEIYMQYLPNPNDEQLEVLYQHNYDDVICLPTIQQLLNAKHMLNNGASISYDLSEDAMTVSIEIDPAQSVPHSFTARYENAGPNALPEGTNFSALFQIQYDCHLNTLQVQIPIYEGTLKYFFPNHNDYYYLPDEDRAIHKSVAAYVDSAHKKKATAATCYEKKSGRFLLQMDEMVKPVFRTTHKDKISWFRVDDMPKDDEFIVSYLQMMWHAMIP